MRDALKLGGDRLDEGILLIRHPHPHRLVQALGPLTGQRNQSPPLLGCPRKQGLSKPYPLPHELAHHVEGFMALFRLQSVDRQHQRRDILVAISEPGRVLLSGRQHRLVPTNRVLDGIVRQPDLVRVL